jgi:hypothetical protein
MREADGGKGSFGGLEASLSGIDPLQDPLPLFDSPWFSSAAAESQAPPSPGTKDGQRYPAVPVGNRLTDTQKQSY